MTTPADDTTDRILAAHARKRADRERERQLDEQSQAARGADWGLAQIGARS